MACGAGEAKGRAFGVPAAQAATGEPQDFPSHVDRVVTRLLAALS